VDGRTSWFTVAAYGQIAGNIAASIDKGDRVNVIGDLAIVDWESDGRKGTSAEITASAVGHDLMFGLSTFTRIARDTREGAGEAFESRPPVNVKASADEELDIPEDVPEGAPAGVENSNSFALAGS
jgi:single-strand DNA-binding protein